MIHPFQPKASDNRNEHPDRLDNVRQFPRAARRGHGGSQQIVESKDVDCIEILQPRPAITFDRRVPAHRSVTHPCRKIDGLHAVFFARFPQEVQHAGHGLLALNAGQGDIPQFRAKAAELPLQSVHVIYHRLAFAFLVKCQFKVALERCQGRLMAFGRMTVHQFSPVMFFQKFFKAMMDEVPANGGS